MCFPFYPKVSGSEDGCVFEVWSCGWLHSVLWLGLS